MTYRLFLDDERFPPDDKLEWVICRNMQQVQEACEQKGLPEFISFDHDLGDDQPTGYDVAKWMIEHDLDQQGQFMPTTFRFYVHSQNPIGAENINKLLTNYLGHKINIQLTAGAK